jgi:hypothetical protein
MSLDMLLLELRVWQCLLISESEVWPSSSIPLDELGHMKRALRRHRKGLALLLQYSDIRTCADAELHRPYWKRASGQIYQCDVCARIAV